MAFRVGQKVVCVDDRHITPDWSGTIRPVKGAIYTIRGWIVGPRQRKPGIVLEEIIHPLDRDGVEANFNPRRFRPVISTDTGMAILEQIRRDVTNKELRPIFQDEQI